MAETKIFARLKADHDRHRKLLDQIDETKGDSPEREKLFEAFRVEVTAHAASGSRSLAATWAPRWAVAWAPRWGGRWAVAWAHRWVE